jgi:hypothetical protein
MYNSIILYVADGDKIPDSHIEEYEILPVDYDTKRVLYVRSSLRLADVENALYGANPYPWETVLNSVPFALTVEFDKLEPDYV